MLTNYIKIAKRNIIRQKGYSFINILGLSLGLALFVLICLYVQFELSFDKFNEKYKRIYRVEENLDGRGRLMAFSHVHLGTKLVEDYPEIIGYVRFLSMGGDQLLSSGDKKFNEDRGWWAEESFFDIFTYRLLQGDHKTALADPFSIVISQKLAEKYFPDENPMGKVLRLNNTHDCRVTGIIEDYPANSHIQYNFLISYASYKTIAGNDYFENWRNLVNYTYVLLSENAILTDINAKIRDILRKTIDEEYPSHVYLKSLSQFHFHSNVIGEVGRGGNMNQMMTFSAIGLFILLIACTNYMNLSTARSSRRIKEIGLRKVTGATRMDLISQFLSEAIFFTLISLILAFIITTLLLPEFGRIVQRNFSRDLLMNQNLVIGMLIATVIVGFIAGSYPAFLLSSLQPANVLNGSSLWSKKNGFIRKGLVVFQFMISIAMMIGAFIIQSQMTYIRNKNLGLEKDHIIVTEFTRMDRETRNGYNTLKIELLKHPSIQSVSVSRHLPTSWGYSATVINGWEGRQEDEDGVYVYLNFVDEDFLDVYGLELMEGRNFVHTDFQENVYSCIINETAMMRFGWENGVGKRLGEDYKVIGIVKDFHFSSLRENIAPLILNVIGEPRPGARAHYQFSVKILPGNMDETLKFIENEFIKIFPHDIFDHRYFGEDLDLMYHAEQRLGKTITYFTILAVLIACLGLFGVASFTAERKTKEIGIRKVLGASIPNILLLFSKEFTKWVLMANIIAWPVAYYVMDKWLQGFAYRTDIGLWIFGLSAWLTFIIALLTVSVQSVKAALMNPVDSLKYE